MKKIYTFLVGALLSLSASAIDYTFNWGKTIEGTIAQSSNIIGMDKSSDGKILVGLTWGGNSVTANPLKWGGANLTDGQGNDINGASYYKGTSSAQNFIATKMDAAGQLAWKVYTNSGNIENGRSGLVATKDGGAVVLLTARATCEGNTSLIDIVDAEGKTTHVQHSDADYWSYRNVLIKISTDGAVEWTRTINALDLTPDGKDASYGVTVNEVAVDANGKIYVGGAIRSEAYFLGARGKQTTVVGGNITGWTGGANTTYGKAFVAQLDSTGYFEQIYVDPTEAAYTSVDRLTVGNGKVYAIGVGKATAAGAIDASLYTFDLSAAEFTPVKKVLAVQKTTAGNQNLQIKDIQVIDGNVYVSGAIVGSLKIDETMVVAGNDASTSLAGFVAKFDTDINPVKSLVIPGTSNTGMYGVEKVGDYILASATMANDGAALYAIPADFSTMPEPTKLVISGYVAISVNPIADGNNLIFVTRGGKSTTASFYGTTDAKPSLTQSYGVLLGSWTISGATGVQSIEVKNDKSSSAYSINGIQQNPESLSKGIYVVDGKKVAVK